MIEGVVLIGREDDFGLLELGKYVDFVVFLEDLFVVLVEEIVVIEVCEIWVDGVCWYVM